MAGDDPGVRAAAAAHPAIVRLVGLVEENRKRFSTDASVSTWALLRHVAPELAKAEAGRINASGSDRQPATWHC